MRRILWHGRRMAPKRDQHALLLVPRYLLICGLPTARRPLLLALQRRRSLSGAALNPFQDGEKTCAAVPRIAQKHLAPAWTRLRQERFGCGC